MKIIIGNKIFNFNQGGFDKLSPYIILSTDLIRPNISLYFYFIIKKLGSRWFYSHRTSLYEYNNVINIDEFYESLKSKLNVYCDDDDEEEKEEIISSIIDEKIRILL